MNGLEKLIELLERHYYGSLVMIFFELVAIVVGFLFVRGEKTGLFFLTYLILDFLFFLCALYVQAFTEFDNRQVKYFINLTNTLVALVELLVYFYFFSKVLRNKMVIGLMKIFIAIFSIIIFLFILTKYSFLTDRFNYMVELIETIEFLFLIPPCFVYFYDLLQNNETGDLKHRPSFWIVTGIFFYAVISVPDYLLNILVTSKHKEYWPITYLLFFSIPFTINFIFLTKAFLCKKTLTI